MWNAGTLYPPKGWKLHFDKESETVFEFLLILNSMVLVLRDKGRKFSCEDFKTTAWIGLHFGDFTSHLLLQ